MARVIFLARHIYYCPARPEQILFGPARIQCSVKRLEALQKGFWSVSKAYLKRLETSRDASEAFQKRFKPWNASETLLKRFWNVSETSQSQMYVSAVRAQRKNARARIYARYVLRCLMDTSFWVQNVFEFFYNEFGCKNFSNFFYNEFGCKNFSNFFTMNLAVKIFRMFFTMNLAVKFFRIFFTMNLAVHILSFAFCFSSLLPTHKKIPKVLYISKFSNLFLTSYYVLHSRHCYTATRFKSFDSRITLHILTLLMSHLGCPTLTGLTRCLCDVNPIYFLSVTIPVTNLLVIDLV